MPKAVKSEFKIFLAKDAPSLEEVGCQVPDPVPPPIEKYLGEMFDAGLGEGSVIKVLVHLPGFTLLHAWLKPNLPVPLHSHNADALNYIVAGSLKMGTETLGPRDSFFIPAEMPYSYRPGPEGVELLEFRHATQFSAAVHAAGPAYWEKAIRTLGENREAWKTAVMPVLNQRLNKEMEPA